MLGGYRFIYVPILLMYVGAFTSSARATLLGTQAFPLPGFSSSIDEVVATNPLSTWGNKGAVGLQGGQQAAEFGPVEVVEGDGLRQYRAEWRQKPVADHPVGVVRPGLMPADAL